MPTKAQQMMIEDGLPAELALMTEEERRADWKGVKLTKPRDLKTPPKDEDPATKALRKEMAKVEERKKAERFARLKELKATTTKQAATPAGQENDVKKPVTKKMRAAKKAAAKKATKKAAPTAAKTAAVNEVVLQIAKMMQRKNGASMAEMVDATGIEAHPMRSKIKQVRDKLGLKTEAPSKENGFRYFVRGPGDAAHVATEPAAA